MKILVAGGAGYLGSVLVPQLIERGYEVDVVDLLWFGNYMPDGVKVIPKEIMTLEEKDLTGYDQVIFIAGLSNDPMAEYSPAANFVDNAALPAYLSYISKRAGVKRFIYGCSCSVYGYSVDVLCDESALATSDYPYGISKLQGEFACLRLQDDKFSTIALRKGTISGYSPRMRLDLIVNAMFKSAVTEKVITVNSPSIWRPILDVRDAASAYIRAIEVDQNISGIFNVAYGNYTVGEVADYVREGVQEHLGITARINIKHVSDFRNYKVTSEKARNVLSFNPRFNIKDTVRNLAENMDKFKDMENPKYYNIQIFKKLNRVGRA
ncbi:MAG: SDR family oxidoreductase [Dehalococcoidia bacterium]|jgi:nucleoside-diphosphate-sugar epimerase